MKFTFSFFCEDIEAQLRFYTNLLGWQERVGDQSPIYRAAEGPNVIIGFHAQAAYALLGLEDNKPSGQNDGDSATTSYPTFYLSGFEELGERAEKALALGGQTIKQPFVTYYGQWQAVFSDPEGKVFRLASMTLPDGAIIPSLKP